MSSSFTTGYSRYVSLMKIILPAAILLSVGFAIGWPYLVSVGKEALSYIDYSLPEIKENRMIRPHYLSTDEKGQAFHIDADWAKQQTNDLANLISPNGSMTTIEGQTFNLKAKAGAYDSQTKILNLEGDVILTSTDGYFVKTEKARVTFDNKVIEGDSYVEGKGPSGEIMAQDGFKVENQPQGKKVITLKGPSKVVIHKLKKTKDSNAP
ncbi:MAG: LPS export ABC transporter periplasmic protein LptC [Alphaproteobacteria bacterium]|nr:LPS export ABC transporter periplasmic protein LptC [Alphaproteobacteria bacterium]MBP7729070.1 LPS export ABC transporter periplasmic protein LptC [Alphaproteobacteria bacterium]